MMTRATLGKLGRRSAGVAFLLVLAALGTLAVQVYQQKFVDAVLVTLRTDRAGNQLNISSEVKARGVRVGEVRDVRSVPDGAEVGLALEPSSVDKLPGDVSALLIPKTLFGERYVQLSIPRDSTASPLRHGDVIRQDRSANAIELERVFDDLLPVLRAVQPQKLATTLTAIATALQGRGEQLGDTLVTAANYLAEFNTNLPKLTDDVRDLAEVSRLYGDIAPDILDSLTDSTVTLNTVAEQRDELRALYAQVTSSTQDVTIFLRNNKENLIRLAASSRAPLELAARYSPSFPCTLKALTDLKPSMDRVLGAGTNQPGLHVQASVTEPRGKYVPGVDDPVYDATGGPKCYPSGVAPTVGTVAAPAGSPAHPLPPGVGGDLGLPNSPQEQELLATLVAPALGIAPGQVAPWWRDTGGVDQPDLVIVHSFKPGVATFGLDGVIATIGNHVFGPNFSLQDPATRLDLVHQLLAEHRLLLIWDNFESVATMPDPGAATPPLDEPGRAELAAFLTRVAVGGKSAILITSRTREPWLDSTIRRIEIGGLPRQDAIDYADLLLEPFPTATPAAATAPSKNSWTGWPATPSACASCCPIWKPPTPPPSSTPSAAPPPFPTPKATTTPPSPPASPTPSPTSTPPTAPSSPRSAYSTASSTRMTLEYSRVTTTSQPDFADPTPLHGRHCWTKRPM